MGKEQSKVAQEGYVTLKETETYSVVTKNDDTFFIKLIREIPKQALAALNYEIDFLQKTNHPHIVNVRHFFKDESKGIYYVAMDHCQGGTLADKLGKPESEHEPEILSWIVEICMALKAIHEANLLHKDLSPKKILLTELGIVRLGGFGNIHESSVKDSNPTINYLAPEVFTGGTYDARSDIWSLGCILFELCTKEQAFSAESAIKLIPKIISGTYALLPPQFSFELCDLLSDLLKKDPEERPTASEIMARPIVLKCLMMKSTTTVGDLQAKLKALRALADGLERVHEGTTYGSLAGGVIGAMGGVTSIVGLILAPFTLGASLIVTGVGVGVGAVGGATAGVSNITNMVNQSNDRKAVRSMIKEFEQKINAVVTWLKEINSSLQTIKSRCPQTSDTDNLKEQNLRKLGFRAGKGISGMTELIRLTRVMSIGKIAAQTSRTVCIAEVATGVLSGLFVAVDIFFVAMDAKEIHHIRKAREEEGRDTGSESGGTKPSSDQAPPLSSSEMSDTAEKEQGSSSPNKPEIKSEVMKFVKSVREAADMLEKVVEELKTIISSIPFSVNENELEWEDME